MSEIYARFVMRDDGLMLGKVQGQESDTPLFKPDTVYQIDSVLGTHIIREVGPSFIAHGKPSGEKVNWGQDASRIVENGMHLYTVDEVERQAWFTDEERERYENWDRWKDER
jgi:hypothetical protein